MLNFHLKRVISDDIRCENFWFPQHWCWGLWSRMLHCLAGLTDFDVSKELHFSKRRYLLPSLLSVTSQKTIIFNEREPFFYIFNDFDRIARCIESKIGTINELTACKWFRNERPWANGVNRQGIHVERTEEKLNQSGRYPSRHSNRVPLVEKLGHYRYTMLQITENCMTLVNSSWIDVYTSV